jgi:hypothetical protein
MCDLEQTIRERHSTRLFLSKLFLLRPSRPQRAGRDRQRAEDRNTELGSG